MSNLEEIADKIEQAYRELYKTDEFIPLHAPYLKGKENEYLKRCIDTGWVSTAGEYVDSFAKQLAEFTGARHIIPVVNGTAALHLALHTIGVSQNDLVICPDVTFVATAAAIRYCGADPVFIDIEEESYGLCPRALESFLIENCESKDGQCIHKQSGKTVRAAIVMHNVGLPARTEELARICESFNIQLVEDAAEALGSMTPKGMCGTLTHIGIYSFNGNKPITTGGGGAVAVNDDDLAQRIKHLSTTAKMPHAYKYIHDELGFNYRMPNVNAAIGCAQLENFDYILKKKREQTAFLHDKLSSLSGVSPISDGKGDINHWFFPVRLESGLSAETLIELLSKRKVMARLLWSQVSEMTPYREFLKGPLPVGEKVLNAVVCLPNGVAV